MARVLVLDQSTTCTGWALIDDELKGKKALIDSGFIKSKEKEYTIRCLEISADIGLLFLDKKPSTVVFEDTSKGHYKSPDVGFKMGFVSGAIAQSIGTIYSYFKDQNPDKVPVDFGYCFQPVKSRKSAVTGNGNAKKEEVQMAVTKLFGLQFYPQEDQADALAGAWMWLQEKGKV